MGCKRKRVEDIRFIQGQGQLCRRHEAAGHAVRRLHPLAPRPCPHQDDRRHQGQGGAGRARGADRGRPQAARPALHADARRRRRGGARRGEGAVPEPGGRLRRRRGALYRGRRRRTGRGRVRGAAGGHRSVQGDGTGRAGAARGPQGQDRWRAWQAQASQPRLQLADRRPRRHRRGLQAGRGDDQGADLLSARAPLPAGDLPARRFVRQDQGRAHPVGHVPGAARDPHRGVADLEDPRAQDSRHRARHRRRVRQQGRRLSGLHLRDRRLDRDWQAGEMGGGPHREFVDHGVRARLPYDDGDRGDEGRQGHGPAGLYAGRPRRIRRLRRPHQMAGGILQHRHRLIRFPGGACGGRRHLHQQGAGRRRLSLLVPRHRGRLLHRARDGYPRRKAQAWIRRSCG